MAKVADSAPPRTPISATMVTSPAAGRVFPPTSTVGHTVWVPLGPTAVVVDDGWKQSGITLGWKAPTRHTAMTSMLNTAAPMSRDAFVGAGRQAGRLISAPAADARSRLQEGQ